MIPSMVICDHRRRSLPRPGTDARQRGPTKALSEDEKGGTTPRFYQTKPVVMLANSQLTHVNSGSYVDYRKMTNGFVFSKLAPYRRLSLPVAVLVDGFFQGLEE